MCRMLISYSRIGNNCIGHYKRGIGLGMTVMFGNIGGVIASNVYRIQDAPRYTRGRKPHFDYWVTLEMLTARSRYQTYLRWHS